MVIDEELKQQAKELWMQGMKYKEISEITGIKESTIKSLAARIWKKEKLQPSNKKVARKVATKVADKAPPEYKLLSEETETIANEELTEKQRLFCLYYVKYRNKVKAYQKAFDCSYINACGHAAAMFKKVAVQQTIAELLKEMREEVKLEAQDIIMKKMQIAFADITDYVSFGVREDADTGIKYNYVDFKESGDIDGTIIHEVKRGKDGVSIKLYDSDKALDWLYDHLIIDDEKRERIKLLKAQTKKLETDADNVHGDNIQDTMDAISDIVSQMQPLGDDDI